MKAKISYYYIPKFKGPDIKIHCFSYIYAEAYKFAFCAARGKEYADAFINYQKLPASILSNAGLDKFFFITALKLRLQDKVLVSF